MAGDGKSFYTTVRDTTAPTLSSATIEVNGNTLTLVFSEAVIGSNGFTITPSGGAATVAYSSGSGTLTLVYTINRTIYDTETVTLDYTAGNVNDLAGNALASISGDVVTNNSTQVQPYLASDTFTDADTTNLTAHTMDVGSGWTSEQGNWAIDTNKAKLSSGGQNDWKNAIVTETGQSDVTIECDITVNSYPGIVFRATDANNHWIIHFRTDSYDLELHEVTAGVETSRAQYGTGLSAGVTHTLKAVLSGADMEFFIDGVSRITYNSSVRQAVTKHGIGQYGSNASDRYDNFLVYQ